MPNLIAEDVYTIAYLPPPITLVLFLAIIRGNVLKPVPRHLTTIQITLQVDVCITVPDSL